MSFIDGIREAGADCAHTFVVFHYGIFPDGIKKLKEAGVTLHPDQGDDYGGSLEINMAGE
jgi:hypothetical protein